MVQVPARVIQYGRVTIPVDVRRRLEIKEGDYVMMDIHPLGGEGDRD